MKGKLKESVLIFCLYSLVVMLVTYPFIFNFSTHVWGYVGDNWGSIWQAWWEKQAAIVGVDHSITPLVGYPWGTNVGLGGVKEWLWWGPVKFFTLLLGEVPAFNLVSLLSFPMAGLTCYWLVSFVLERNRSNHKLPRLPKYLTSFAKVSLPAFVSGLVYSFAPYHFWQSYTHISLGQIQWLPLYFLALLYFFEKPNIKSGLLWGVSFGALVYSSFYYTYFVVLVSIPLVLLCLARQPRLLRQRSAWFGLIALALISAASLVPVYFSIFQGRVVGAAGDILHRDIQDLLSLSLRPWDFIIPAPDHFLFGKFTDLIYAWIRGFSMDFKTISAYLPERVVYVGWVGLLLTGVSAITWVKGGKRGMGGMCGFVLFFGLLVLLAGLLGLPPFIYFKTHKIVFPAYYLYKLFPMFRVYTRTAVLIQLGIAVLAGFGLQLIFHKIKKLFIKIAFTLGVLLLILLEFQGESYKNTTEFANLEKVNPAYEWLIEKGKPGAIIEYPQEYDTQEALFFQRLHRRPIFNMLGEPEQYILWKKFHNITDPEVPGMLATLGIKYAVWHHTDTLYNPRGNPMDEPRYRKFYPIWLDKDTAELELVYKGPDAYIYEIKVGPSFGSKEDVLEAVKSSVGN